MQWQIRLEGRLLTRYTSLGDLYNEQEYRVMKQEHNPKSIVAVHILSSKGVDSRFSAEEQPFI